MDFNEVEDRKLFVDTWGWLCLRDKKENKHKEVTISSRAVHSILKIARTIADLDESMNIEKEHLLEAIQHRRYGDNYFFWNFG